ncbi:MAG TPA: dihydrodipicolinate synthase family protein [Usitatibacteraceae bacterium]|nr:dihydrodipicolinate synthase family protein [Usitatibacteraceae bacterium]
MMLCGVIPILATPFNDDESLDLVSWQRLIRFMLDAGADGLTILGVLGEANRLTDAERDSLISSAVTTVEGRVPLVVGVSHAGTFAAGVLAARAEELGASAVMLAPHKEPVANDERIVELYKRVARATSLPIVLQDHPASTEVQMSAALIARIVDSVPSIQAIKAEAVPTAPKIRALREQCKTHVAILAGLGALYAPFDLAEGIDGFNTGFAFPEVLKAMVSAAHSGNFARVHALYARFAALIVFEQQPGLAVRKEILRRRGMIASARVRHPGAALPAGSALHLDRLLAAAFGGQDLSHKLEV